MPPRRAASGRAAASASRRVSYKEEEEEEEEEDDVGGSTSESGGGSPSEFEVSGQSGQEGDDDDEEDLDTATSEEEEEPTPKRKGRQKGRQSASSAASAKRRGAGSAKSTPVKRQKVKDDGDVEEDGEQPEFVGGEVMSVTKLVPPPREKHEPGKLGRPVIDFLAHLADPKYNDREWFHTNERVWKWVKEDWELFVGSLLESLMEEADDTIPWLPVKELVYRIHRDIRFSNDKTPFRKTLMATYSRGGRKGPFAGYHLCVRAKDETAMHAGIWCPPNEHLNAIREHIKNESPEFHRLQSIISDKEFVKWYGAPQPSKKEQGSMWGRDDELKNAPKGVDKQHPQIHFLRLKSFVVAHRFTDAQVLDHGGKGSGSSDFKSQLVKACQLAAQFVECLNEMIHPDPGASRM